MKGEPSLSVVLQLERAVQISSVTIGNYHSAMIEVLVGKSETPTDKFEVLVCTSCFMSPNDSRNSLNVSNVKTFNTNQLVQDTQSKKWDRVRVVCTQPYNKHIEVIQAMLFFSQF
jgi:DNA-repair protein XRCC1